MADPSEVTGSGSADSVVTGGHENVTVPANASETGENLGENHGEATFDDLPAPAKKAGRFATFIAFLKPRRVRAEGLAALEEERARIDNSLRRAYGWALFAVMSAQLVAADWFIYRLAVHNNWDISDGVVIAYLTSVVVEVIGLVTLVTTYLFRAPERSV